MKKLFPILILIAAISITSFAQFKPQRPPDNRAHLRERVGLIRMWKLIERLELTEQQSLIFFPAMNEHDVRIRTLRDEEERLLDKIEAQFQAITLDMRALEAVVDSVAMLRDERLSVELVFIDKVNQILTVEQKAKFLLFDRVFEKEIRSVIDMGLREEDKPKPYKTK